MGISKKISGLISRLFRRGAPNAAKARMRSSLDPRMERYGKEELGPGITGVATGIPADKRDGRRIRTLSGNDVEKFMWDRAVLPVYSSNVEALQYLSESKTLIVKYLGKGKRGGGSRFYAYGSISPNEAYQFTQAQSKGKEVWDVLRVRGSRTAHKKPYHPVGGFAPVKGKLTDDMVRDMMG